MGSQQFNLYPPEGEPYNVVILEPQHAGEPGIATIKPPTDKFGPTGYSQRAGTVDVTCENPALRRYASSRGTWSPPKSYLLTLVSFEGVPGSETPPTAQQAFEAIGQIMGISTVQQPEQA